ncbi:RNA polymerase sigma factor [Wansuia hejianensis]|uniref:Sigma-70 family RNA polymerase sigma factor n=1 Tax=Wansuia hejianensis TaxID=2763667 RepID=A0A926EUG2_9FIRM|nr:sigma-70 family RNA polymerase sigma factor [Wansuia hejianensis]MBC8590028.1 sigma-70 family RNA polymerase sigma factor [Wansuia hejianensis]
MEKESVLIKKAVEGDEDSFAKLIEIYKNYVFAIILNFIKDYTEVENVAQEVFLQTYISLPKYENDNFKGWISRIATNKSIDWLRKKRSKFKEETMEVLEEVVDVWSISNKDTPESWIIEKENKEDINKILNLLPQIYIDVIRKFYFEEKSYDEIAKEEGVTIKTIESRLYRGRKILREKWRERL